MEDDVWTRLFERKSFKIDARWGLLNDKVRIYRVSKGEMRELLGRREAPSVLVGALESKKKATPLKVMVLSKTEVFWAAQAIVKDITGQADFVGGAKQVLHILRGMVEKESQ